jgi:hypothetical protein
VGANPFPLKVSAVLIMMPSYHTKTGEIKPSKCRWVHGRFDEIVFTRVTIIESFLPDSIIVQ